MFVNVLIYPQESFRILDQNNALIKTIGHLLGRGTDEAERGAPKNVGFVLLTSISSHESWAIMKSYNRTCGKTTIMNASKRMINHKSDRPGSQILLVFPNLESQFCTQPLSQSCLSRLQFSLWTFSNTDLAIPRVVDHSIGLCVGERTEPGVSTHLGGNVDCPAPLNVWTFWLVKGL